MDLDPSAVGNDQDQHRAIQTVPGSALLDFMVSFIGSGRESSIIAFTLYALLPILRHTYTGALRVDPAIVETGRGLGMTSRQILLKVELPLSLPIIMAGIRTASVFTAGLFTPATFIGRRFRGSDQPGTRMYRDDLTPRSLGHPVRLCGSPRGSGCKNRNATRGPFFGYD